jgi:hypothetical protein
MRVARKWATFFILVKTKMAMPKVGERLMNGPKQNNHKEADRL